MANAMKNDLDAERRAARWDRFWDGVWVYGAAFGLLVLVSQTHITM